MEGLEKDFVPYELAWRMKELGFNEPCIVSYGDRIEPYLQVCGQGENASVFNVYGRQSLYLVLAPTWQSAFRWFRDKYELSHSIELIDNSRHYYYDFTIYDSKNRDYNDEDCFDSCKRIYDDRKFSNYEEAEQACLVKLIDIIENK